MSRRESEYLDDIARSHIQSEGFTPRLIACRARTLEEILEPGVILDLGCGDGLLTAYLGRRHRRVLSVDASSIRIERARSATSGLKSVELIQTTFEELEFPSGELFDAIVLSCVLEHLLDPVGLLERVSSWVSPEGRVVAIVPNAGSLHRRVGVKMGMLEDIDDPGEEGETCGHHQIYSMERLEADFEKAGYEVINSGGYLLKPVSNEKMTSFSPALVDAFEELGRDFPDLAAEIYAAGELR